VPSDEFALIGWVYTFYHVVFFRAVAVFGLPDFKFCLKEVVRKSNFYIVVYTVHTFGLFLACS